ncbi:MAG TPA: glycosyltransferase [Pirellulales bacterium]|jgi:glycosyltransferase involved in cell wall biosynthesis
MPPKRILFLINTLRTGGWERDVAMICRHIDQTRFLPEVWTLLPGGENEPIVREAGIVVRCLERRRAADPFFSLRVARELARSNFDLWHAFLPSILYYAAFARTLHRSSAPLLYSEGTIGLSSRWRGPLFRWAIHRHCSMFTANSRSSQAFLTSQGVAPEKIAIIPNGHEFTRFRNPLDRQALRDSLGITPNQRLAITVGRLTGTKRVSDLIDAFGRLSPDYPDWRLAIVGDGEDRQQLEAQVQQQKLQAIVQFLGTRRDVPELLRSADLFVFPSEMEGLPNAVIEASLASLPIVACDIAALREVIEDGRNGTLVPTRDALSLARAMRGYMDGREVAEQHGQTARAIAEQRFAIENTVERLYELYEQVFSTH